MNSYGLTLTEIGTLILISEGKSIDDIVKDGYPSMEKFDDTIRNIMNKTNANTWEELKAIGSQLTLVSKSPSGMVKPIDAFSDPDALLKEHIEAFCYLYEELIKEHKMMCDKCKIISPGLETVCPEQGRLRIKKLDWMDRLITKL